jgi:hypothetical protein
MGGECSAHEIVDEKCVQNVLVGKPEGKRPLGKPRLRGKDNIKMDLGAIEFRGVEWIHMVHDRDR